MHTLQKYNPYIILMFLFIICNINQVMAQDACATFTAEEQTQCNALYELHQATSDEAFILEENVICDYSQSLNEVIAYSCDGSKITLIEVKSAVQSAEYNFETFPDLTTIRLANLDTIPQNLLTAINQGTIPKITIMGNVPIGIEKLNSITYLQLEELEEIPAEVWRLTQLERLEISSSEMAQLPDEIGNLTALKKVEFHTLNNLTTLPETIGNWGELEEFGMVGLDNLNTLPSTVGNWKNLKMFYATGLENFQTLPEESSNWSQLEVLTFWRTGIIRIPASVGQIQSLQEIELLDNNQLTKIPESFGTLQNLTYVNILVNEQLAEIPEALRNIAEKTGGNINSNNTIDQHENILFLVLDILVGLKDVAMILIGIIGIGYLWYRLKTGRRKKT